MISDRSWGPYWSQENAKEKGPAGPYSALVPEATEMQNCWQPLGACHTSGSPLCTEDWSKLSTTLRSPSSRLPWGSPAGATVISAPRLCTL